MLEVHILDLPHKLPHFSVYRSPTSQPQILDVLNKITEIYLFPELVLSQNEFKYTSAIKMTFYVILNSTYTCIGCHILIPTSSNFCDLEVPSMRNIQTGIQTSKLFNLIKYL